VVGLDYQTKQAQRQSQTDDKKGFGGHYGIQKNHQDKEKHGLLTLAVVIITIL